MIADRAHSILNRLRDKARKTNTSLHLRMQLFCQEEFLRRLSMSNYRDRLILKGGLLLYSLSGFSGRPTRDVDFVARGIQNRVDTISKGVNDIIGIDR